MSSATNESSHGPENTAGVAKQVTDWDRLQFAERQMDRAWSEHCQWRDTANHLRRKLTDEFRAMADGKKGALT